MADNIESRIDLNIDVSNALSSIRTLQAQISAFHQSIRNSGNSVNQAVSDQLTKNLLNSINATKQFSASLTTVKDSAQSFTNALEKNKLSLGQYFKFGAASTKTFGRLFRNEFDTIEKVARERVKTLQTQYIRMGRDANGALEAIKVRPLRLDMEQLGTQVSMTAQKQQLFNQLLKQGSTNLLNFGKNTQWAGRQLMVGFTIPLSIMGSMAIKEFEKIEKQAIRFRRVYGDAFSTEEETKQALQNMRELATEFTKYGIEVNKTLELAADVAQMGLTGADLRAQVTEATRLAVLGEVEQQEALEATISVTNAFGVAADDLAKKIDFLNAVENQTVTSISDLTIAIPKAGPVIQQLGGNVEDLAFFLTAMREGGINASEGANALKSGLSKIINPTEKASQMLAGFGINLNGIVEANKGDIKATVLSLAEAFDTLDPLNRARAIEQLFGTFQFARLSTLFQNVTKEGGQAQRILELTNASAQQLAILSERELKKVEESPLFKLQKAIERLQEALAPLGEEFIKIITPLIQFGTDVLKKFNEMDAGAKAFVTNVVTVLGLIAPVAIMTFGLLANGIANFVKGINFVRGLFGKLAGAGTGLNQMTQYMTQEQLEATAAASALGQAHSQLTTVFTAESRALSGLTTAYNNAIIAINRYNAASAQTRARPGTQAKGYASGILSVPGPKGKGDIIPAMLSPGEAVIPAEEAQKYRSLIAGIISNRIPGFVLGTENVTAGKSADFTGSLSSVAYRAYTNAVGFQSSAVNQLAGNAPSLAKAPASAFSGDIASKGALYFAPLLVDIIENTIGPSGSVTQELKSNPKYKAFATALADRVSTELNTEFGKNKVAETVVQQKTRTAAIDLAPQYGINADAVKTTFDMPTTFQDEQTVRVQSSGDVTPANRGPVAVGKRSYTSKAFQEDAIKAAQILAESEQEIEIANKIKAGLAKKPGQARPDIELGHVGLSERMPVSSIVSSVNQAGLETSAQLNKAIDLASRGKRGLMLGKSATGEQLPRIEVPASFSREQIRQAKEQAKLESIAATGGAADATIKQTVQDTIQEGKRQLEISSPSEKAARELGLPIAQGMAKGIKDGKPVVDSAIKDTSSLKLPSDIASKMGMSATVGGRPEADKKTSAFGKIKDVIGQKAKTVVSKGLKGIENKLEESLTSGLLGKTALGQAMIDNAMSDAIEKSGSGGAILTNSKGQVLDSYDGNAAINKVLNKKEELLDREEGLTQSQDYLLQENSQQLSQTGDQQLTRKQLIAQEKAEAADQKRIQKQAAAQKRQQRAGRAFGALGTATMVAGMASGIEGPVGDIARGAMPALAGLSAIAPILMALPAPLALLAAGVGVAAFAFMEWNKMMEQARQEGVALANALTMTTDKLIKLSEATGKVSATEERRKKEEDQLSGEEAKSRKFGMTFLESEAGQQFLADISAITSSGLGKEESAEAAGRQLAMMMAQGLISSGEAASIASAIGGEINDYNFAAKVAGEVIELTGPNGEDLTKDPLKVALAIQQGSMENIEQISELAMNQETINKNVKDRIKEERKLLKEERDIRFARGGFEGFGAGLEGWAADGFGFGLIGNFLSGTQEGEVSDIDPEFVIEANKENAKLQAASVQLGINQVQQNQQILDSTEKQFEQKIKQKEQEIAATASVEKKKKLEQELNEIYRNRDTAVKDINKANAESLNQIVQMKKDYDPTVFSDAIKTSVLAAYSEDNPMRVFAEDAVDRLNALEDSEFKTQIQLQFASGELSVDAVNALLGAEKVNPQVTTRYKAVVDKRGVAAGGQLLDLMTKAGLSPNGINTYMTMFANIQTEEEFDNATEALAQIANMEKEYGFKVNLESNANKDTLSDVTDMVKMTKDMPKKVTKEQAIQFQSDYIKKGGKANPNFQAVIDNWDKIFGEGMVGSAEVFVEFTATGDYDSVNRYLTGSKAEGGLGLDAKGVSLYFQSMNMDPAFKKKIQDAAATYDVALGNKNKPDPGDKIDEEETGGGAGKENPLDALLRRLKLVRDASINASGGIKILRDAMRNGTKATTKFLGIEQKLLQQGVSKRFIDELMSMDEEFRKQYLTGEKSGVVKLTKDGERLSQLLNELTLGDYNISISANVQEVNAQVSAMTKLTAAGMSLSDSSEVVQDRQLALAIAHATTKEEVQLLVDGYKELKKAEQAFLLATPEGRQREFQSIYSEANAFFAAEEERQNLRYEAAVKAYEVENDIVDAQRRSADIEFELDDLQYALGQIAEQEAKINEEYDKREEAIENIFKANKAIIDQDKEKLDIAGALASGDLAAAAKAMRAQTTANLERNKENQLENLRKSRELDLAQVRDKQGKSRIELETQIRDLEKESIEIQEQKLEPYQRQLDLLDRIRQDALQDVQDNGFLGMTQARWAEIANDIERARFGVDGYADALRARLLAIPGFSVDANGQIQVDSAMLQQAAVTPSPGGNPPTGDTANQTTTTATEKTETQKQIDELNRRIAITRWRVNNEKLTADQKQELMQLNIKRIKEAQRLGGPNAADMTSQIQPGTTKKITELAPGFAAGGYVARYMRMGGLLPYKAEGGTIFGSMGTDTVPAMLTPGEFVVRRHAVSNFGVDRLKAINNGTYKGDSMYNYNLSINVKSDANPDEIARSVMAQIKRIDSQRIRGNRF